MTINRLCSAAHKRLNLIIIAEEFVRRYFANEDQIGKAKSASPEGRGSETR
jgi:hypothetical protein